MFGKNKNKKKPLKNLSPSKNLEKVVMGAIIGGAIGSVLGVSLAPQKGKDTRKMIIDKAKEISNKNKKKGLLKWLMEKPGETKAEKKEKKIPLE